MCSGTSYFFSAMARLVDFRLNQEGGQKAPFSFCSMPVGVYLTLSTSNEIPCPPPMQSDARPRFESFRTIS